MINHITNTKGFTLLELLIVIGILAILGTIAVIVINPAQLFAEARDSQRISNLRAIQSAIKLYLAIVPDANFHGGVAGRNCAGANVWRASIGALAGANCPFGGTATATAAEPTTTAIARAVDGTGWVSALDTAVTGAGLFTEISGGSPLASLPVDPRPNATTFALGGRFFAFKCGGITGDASRQYEINANMESTRFSNAGTSDVESVDGGNDANVYEFGNDPDLNLTCA